MPKIKPTFYKGPIKITKEEKKINRENNKCFKKRSNPTTNVEKEMKSRRAAKKSRTTGQGDFDSSAFHFDDDGIDYTSSHEDEATSAPATVTKKPTITMNDLWKKHGKILVEWYVEAMAKGEPHMLSINLEQEAPTCTCTMFSKKVTLYMIGCRF